MSEDRNTPVGKEDVYPDQLTAALVALAEHGIPPDVQELLVVGSKGIPPGALVKALSAARSPAAASVESEGLQLGDVTEFRPDAPHASEWRGVELTIVSLRADPDGNQWVSAIERQERHRGGGQYDGETTDIDASHLRLIRRKAAPLNSPAENVWQPISTAPKADKDSTQAISFIGWCPDDTAPGGGDQRVVWWEPRMKKGAGCWWGDRDLEETPTHWKQLGEPPAFSATERHCQKCGEATKSEEAWVNGEIWCHPCADAFSPQQFQPATKDHT